MAPIRIARCVICNSVNHEEIQTDDGDLSYKTFHEVVPYGTSGVPAFVCYDCQDSHSNSMKDYDYDEEDVLGLDDDDSDIW